MKRYIGNTGRVYVINDGRPSEITDSLPDKIKDINTGSMFGSIHEQIHRDVKNNKPLFDLSSIFGGLRGGHGHKKLLPGFEAGDFAILALLFFLYKESGDEEFLIVLAFFALGIINK